MKRKSPNAKEFQMWMIEVEKRVGEKTKTIEREIVILLLNKKEILLDLFVYMLCERFEVAVKSNEDYGLW